MNYERIYTLCACSCDLNLFLILELLNHYVYYGPTLKAVRKHLTSICFTCIDFCYLRFVDGASYMAAVADALGSAKEEIFITDWM